jgi:hypothetical protein
MTACIESLLNNHPATVPGCLIAENGARALLGLDLIDAGAKERSLMVGLGLRFSAVPKDFFAVFGFLKKRREFGGVMNKLTLASTTK